MATNVFELWAKIGLDSKDYDEGLGNAKSAASEFASGLGNILGGVTAAVGAAVAAAATGVASLVKQSVEGFAEYEQLVGGAKKIFDEMDYDVIAEDAANAWKTMNISASQYLEMINSVGASFSATMGDQKGYETAKQGMQAIADYASGTGKSVELLNEKYSAITRSAGTYQSIADNFSGILPATSKDFLEQAQAAGLLSTKYEQLTDVPIAEYQQAVSAMLEEGVERLGLAGNTVEETEKTISGSLNGLKAAWRNLITGMSDSSADLDVLLDNVVTMAGAVIENILPAVSQALQSVARLIKELAPIIAEELPGLISEVVPLLLDAAVTIVGALTEALPELIESIMQTISDILPQISDTVISLLDTLVGTILPTLLELGGMLIMELAGAILENLPQLSETALNVIFGLIDFFMDALPQLITVGMEIVTYIAKTIALNAPNLIEGVVVLLKTILLVLIENMPMLINAGLIIIEGLIDGLLSNMPLIIDSVVLLIVTMVTTIIENLPQILAAAIRIGLKIVEGVVLAIPQLIKSVGEMLGIVKDTKNDMDGQAKQMQKSVNTSTTGISSSIDSMIDNLNSKTNSAKSTLKSTTSYTKEFKDDMNKKADDLEKTAVKVQKGTIVAYENIQSIISHARAAMKVGFEQMELDLQGLILKLEELGAVNAVPTVDPSGVEEGCNAIVEAVNKAITALNNLSNAGGGGGGGFGGGHASGGWMQAGTTYLVGELGPELVTPSRSGYVHTASETASMLGGGQTINISINGDVYDDEYSMKRKLRNAMLDVLQEQMAYG